MVRKLDCGCVVNDETHSTFHEADGKHYPIGTSPRSFCKRCDLYKPCLCDKMQAAAQAPRPCAVCGGAGAHASGCPVAYVGEKADLLRAIGSSDVGPVPPLDVVRSRLGNRVAPDGGPAEGSFVTRPATDDEVIASYHGEGAKS